jgi:Protein of unknown function (DUF3558)
MRLKVRRALIHLAAFVLALLLGLAAVGCGDDDEPAKDDAATVRTEPRSETAETSQTAESTDTSDAGETGSGGANASGGAGELPDPCKLVTASEVKEAVRRDVAPQEESGKAIDGPQYRQCNWTAIGHEDSAAVRVISGTRRYDTLLRDLGGAGARIVRLNGLGDAAFTASGFSGETAGGTRGATIFVKADGKTLTLALANDRDEGPRADLVALMEKMLSRAN